MHSNLKHARYAEAAMEKEWITSVLPVAVAGTIGMRTRYKIVRRRSHQEIFQN
jgi:hypothetical protein